MTVIIEKKKVDDLVNKGAILVDMRSPVKFRDDPVSGAVNLPLRNLVNSLTTLQYSKKTKDDKVTKSNSKIVVLFSDTSDDVDLKAGVNYSENLGFTAYITSLDHIKVKNG